MEKRELPSQEWLKENFSYNPQTGDVCRIKQPRTGKRVELGVPIRRTNPKGYYMVTLPGRMQTTLQRLIWKWMTGEEPDYVDHKDGVIINNEWDNLRNSTQTNNLFNTRLRSNNSTGIKGLYEYTPSGRKPLWKGSIVVNGEKLQKYFPYTEEGKQQAIEWLAEQRKHHGEFANSGV